MKVELSFWFLSIIVVLQNAYIIYLKAKLYDKFKK